MLPSLQNLGKGKPGKGPASKPGSDSVKKTPAPPPPGKGQVPSGVCLRSSLLNAGSLAKFVSLCVRCNAYEFSPMAHAAASPEGFPVST